jgi:hypothetical protein
VTSASRLAAVFLLVGCAIASFVQAAEPDIVGTWRLVSYEDKPPTGTSLYPYGSDPKGLLMYDATGHMSIQIMKVPHPKVASGDDARVTPDEKQALYDAYVAYFGTYTLDRDQGVVIHHVEADLADVFIGSDESRPFVLRDDTLILAPHWQVNGKTWHGIRVFTRVSPDARP